MKDYEKWFRKTEADLLNIKNNLNAEDTPADTCCFHAQQAAEKYLKAYLVSRNISFPKTHDLKYLLNCCVEINGDFTSIQLPAFSLFTYSISPRYPDDLDELNIEEAKRLMQMRL